MDYVQAEIDVEKAQTGYDGMYSISYRKWRIFCNYSINVLQFYLLSDVITILSERMCYF